MTSWRNAWWVLVVAATAQACLSPLKSATMTHVAPELWLHPNVGSPDLIALLASDTGWEDVRARTTTIGLHHAVLLDHCFQGRGSCGVNTLDRLTPALDAARTRGLRLSVEAAPIKEWDCTGDVLRGLLPQYPVDSLSMDWPFAAGRQCGLTIADAAAIIRRWGVSRPILTTGYPMFGPADHQAHLEALLGAGVILGGVHLDIDRLRVGRGAASDLRRIRALVRDRGLPFGLIIWGERGTSTAAWAADARASITNLLQDVYACDVDRIIVQSWSPVRDTNLKLWPLNLPSNNPDTLTGVAARLPC